MASVGSQILDELSGGGAPPPPYPTGSPKSKVFCGEDENFSLVLADFSELERPRIICLVTVSFKVLQEVVLITEYCL